MKSRILCVVEGMEFGGGERVFSVRKMITETIQVYDKLMTGGRIS